MSQFTSGISAPAQSTIIPIDCDEDIAVGDLVRQSRTVDNRVYKATENTVNDSVFGKVIQKTSTNTCIVLLLGKVSSTVSLTRGEIVFLSTSGVESSVAPATGNVQILGLALSSDSYIFNPNYDLLVR